MAISYVGGATAVSAGNADVSVSLTALTGGSDSAPSANDLIIFAYNIADADNVDLNLACNTAGFTEIADLFGDGSQDANLGVYWKLHTSDTAVVGEGSLGGTDTAIQGVVMVFRGVDTGTPFDVTSTTNQGATGGNPDPPSINHNNPAGLWTVIAGANAHTANADGSFTAPTGYTTDFLTVGNQDTADGIIGMGYNTAPSDPEDPGAMTSSHTATGWCAVTMALRPASATPTRGRISFAEFEAPSLATRGRISWTEFETPFTATRGRVSWAEFEAPIAPTRGRVSFTEFEVPFPPGSPTRGRVSWAELETPLVSTRGRISWAEVEVPTVLTRGRISFAEFETPLAPTRGRTSWAELEVPAVATRGRISWVEFQVPDVGGSTIPTYYPLITRAYIKQWFLLNGPSVPFE